MPLEPTSFCASLSGVVLGKLPTAAVANRTNAAMGIVPHNPYIEMVNACALGWLTTIMMPGIIIDAYAGVVGAVGTPVLTPILFPRAATVTAAFQSSMAWVGASSTLVAQALTLDIWTLTMSLGLIQVFPLAGAAVGVGVVNPLTLAALGPQFTTNLTTQFTAKGFFSPGDTKAGLTPEISLLITNLSAAYAMNMGGLTTAAPIVYAGAPIPTPPAPPVPAALPNTGSII